VFDPIALAAGLTGLPVGALVVAAMGLAVGLWLTITSH
jgi:hypothetical protein